MSFNYGPNYTAMLQALQKGGLESVQAAKSARTTRGLGVSPRGQVEKLGEDAGNISKRLLAKFNEVHEGNKQLKEKIKSQSTPEVDFQETEPTDIRMSGDIASFVAGFEGFKNKPYWDVNKWTYGYGSSAPNETATITEEEAKKLLQNDLLEARSSVMRFKEQYGYDWSENQIDALTSFTQNLGQGNLEKLLTGDEEGARGDEEISEMILEYNKADGKVLPGLTKRRQAEAKLFTQGYD